jgi:hypothetical protein
VAAAFHRDGYRRPAEEILSAPALKTRSRGISVVPHETGDLFEAHLKGGRSGLVAGPRASSVEARVGRLRQEA